MWLVLNFDLGGIAAIAYLVRGWRIFVLYTIQDFKLKAQQVFNNKDKGGLQSSDSSSKSGANEPPKYVTVTRRHILMLAFVAGLAAGMLGLCLKLQILSLVNWQQGFVVQRGRGIH